MHVKSENRNVVVYFPSQISKADAEKIRDDLCQIIEKNPDWEKIVLDVNDMQSLEVFHLQLLVGIYKTCFRNSRNLELVNETDELLDTLKMLKL